MSIVLSNNFKISVMVLETENYLPSIKLGISTVVPLFTSSLEYEFEAWFLSRGWNSFVSDLQSNPSVNATLQDLSEKVTIRVYEENSIRYLNIFVKNHSTNGVELELQVMSKITWEDITVIKNYLLTIL